nr:hypothetical protein [Tanacetum cinerariifolium]
MTAVNNQRDSVSPPPLATKPKKRKSQTGTRKSKPLPEGTATHPKDSKGNKQPLDKDITFTAPDEGTTKSTPRPEGSLGNKDSGETNHPLIWNHYTTLMLISQGLVLREPDTQPMILSYADVRAILLSEDEAQESKEDILGAGDEMDDTPRSDETQHQSSPPQGDKPTSSTIPHTEASETDSSSDNILKKYDDTLPITEQQLVNTTITDLYKGLKVITQLFKDIKNSVKDDPTTNKKIKEASETLAKISTQTTKILSLVSVILTFAIIDTPANVEGENATYTTTEEPPSYTEGETDANIQEKPEEPKQSIDANTGFICSSTHPPITKAQPITIIYPQPSVPQREGKRIATDDQVED